MTIPREIVLWQGRPRAVVDIFEQTPLRLGLGLALFGGLITPMLVLRGAGIPYWGLFVPIMAVGFWLCLGAALGNALRRWRTRYYLSDRRVVIDTLWPWGVRRVDHPLSTGMTVRLEPPNVRLLFAGSPGSTGSIALEHLDDAAQVAEQMRHALCRAP